MILPAEDRKQLSNKNVVDKDKIKDILEKTLFNNKQKNISKKFKI